MGDPGRAHHALPRPGGPSPGTGRARPGAGALTRRIRALPDGAMSTLTWDQGSEMARHQRQGRRHRDRACSFAHPHSPWERRTNENTNRHRGPLPAQRHPHHQPPTPTRAPSPTNRATAPAPPSTTPPHKKHSPNSLPPPLDTTIIEDTDDELQQSSCGFGSDTPIGKGRPRHPTDRSPKHEQKQVPRRCPSRW